MGEVRNGDQKVRKYLFSEIFYGRQAVSYEEFFPRNFGVGGVKKILGEKNASYEEFFPKNSLAQNFLRKKKLEYSQPRKFLKFYEEILGSLDNRTEISTR